MMKLRWKQPSVLPGFGLTMGYTVLYLSLIVLIPLGALFLRAAQTPWADIWKTVSDTHVLAALRLSFGASLAAAGVNVVFGMLVAWMLTRYRFPGRRIIDALVDLPFALPTAVSGIALTTLYAPKGLIGAYLLKPYIPYLWHGSEGWAWQHLALPLSLKVAFTPLGIVLALTFIGLPFVVRTLQPALQDLDLELEEAAASLGASRWQTFRRVVLPSLYPALLTGFALAFARALGEYGSVVFIAGNLPGKTEIAPLLIMTKLEQYDYGGATVIAVVMLAASFVILLGLNGLQWWQARARR